MSPKPWENAEGYVDPTAYNAIKKVSAEEHEALDAKVNTLIKVLKFIIAESGFELAARIELRGQDNAAHIAEEIADVEIMLEQLKLMFNIRDEVTQQRTAKLQRLDNRISQSLTHPKP